MRKKKTRQGLWENKANLSNGLWREERRVAYLLMLPSLLLYTLLVVVPCVNAIWLSFFEWNGFAPTKKYVGLENYKEVFLDSQVHRAYMNNVIWASISVFVVFFGLIIAVVLYQERLRGKTFFRVCYFFPYIFSNVITGIIWGWIYNPRWGALNAFLKFIGLPNLQRAWLGDPSTVLYALICVGSWTYYGFCMVIFLSALQSLPVEVSEAARMDGANRWQELVYITIPQLRNQVTMLLVLTTIWSFKVFDLVYVMTGGSPYGRSEVMSFLIYVQAFQFNKVGYASATSLVLTLTVAVGTLIFLKVREKGGE